MGGERLFLYEKFRKSVSISLTVLLWTIRIIFIQKIG